MNTPKVAVLLCAYNGSAYIKEQVDSILGQTWSNLHLYIQDDCSTDNTREILMEYSAHPEVTLISGDCHLGYPMCFYDLLSGVTDADYYAFSDQDDVWLPDKILRSVKLLRKCNPKKPALYYANYYICDKNLNTLHSVRGPSRKPDFPYSLYSSSLGLGFTYVLNEKARKLVTGYQPKKILTKDWWIGMCCTAFGSACYDPVPCALHRRHENAATPEAKTFAQIQRHRIKHFFFSDEGFRFVRDGLNEFYDVFRDRLPPGAHKTLSFFLNSPPRPLSGIQKAFYPKRLRYEFFDEILLRLIFLFGRL
ncbi:MAG: glycosyltransferase [Lachnospiraceae bacterium]|nr:glycosyltransferase [Lachnospiraceae bacterium]